MAKAAPIQTSFTAGELSPRLEGRVDIAKYFSGLKALLNMKIHTHGGASRRGGTKHISNAKEGTKKCRLIPFQYSIEQAYIIEIGEGYLHFYKDEEKIGGGGFSSGFSSGFTGDSNVYEIVTTYTEAELFEIQYVQSADLLYIVHPSHPPAKLSRLTATTFKLEDVNITSNPFSVTNGYPSCVAFYESRLIYAGTIINPQTIWGSKTGDYDNFTQGSLDDDSYEYTINSDEVNVIRWLSAGKSLVIGTVGAEFLMSASSSDEAITPSNIKIVQQTEYGSAYMQPIRSSGIVLFVQRAARKILQFVYEFESDSYVAPDLTLLSEHITSGGIVVMAHQKEPDPIIWSVRNDGTLLGMTFDRAQEVIGWARHEVGGVSDVDGLIKAKVESIAVIPKDDRDQVWISAKRWINGEEVRQIEVIEEGRDSFNAEDGDDFFIDSGVRYSGAKSSVIGGGAHLEGLTVSVLADGAVVPDTVVSNGSITLPKEYAKVNYGIKYMSELETMRLEAGSQNGTSQGKIKRISSVVIRFYQTLGAKIGPNRDNLDTIPFRSTNDAMDSAPPRFSGDKTNDWDAGYETEGRIIIRQEQPLPMTVLAIMPRERTNG